MTIVKIALANLRYPENAAESVTLAQEAIARAAREGAAIICFPEVFIPGYRMPGKHYAPIDVNFLDQAWSRIADSARASNIAVVLGTERVANGTAMITALVIDTNGTRFGFQDKVQLDPSEESIYEAGEGRRVFYAGDLAFGVAICHEGFRYPETVRWAAQRGAHVVFHPHYSWPEEGTFRPTEFADAQNTFHEKAILCRAAENTCFVATVNYATEGSPTTSAVVRPDGTVQAWQPYGREGLLIVDIDTDQATRLLALRTRPV